MCTLIIGRGVVAPDTVLIGANRDERPDRPSDGPGLLCDLPPVVGGRDREGGGTWLAVREGRSAVAVLNRRDTAGATGGRPRRSRGLLALDVAAVAPGFALQLDPAGERRELLARIHSVSGPGLAHAALCRAFAALWEADYAPFSLVFADLQEAWLLTLDADRVPRCQPIPNGWHVLTHADLDDETDPRTARLLYDLAFFHPLSLEKAEQRVGDLLRSHGLDRGIAHPRPVPPVCLHEGPMTTVSSTLLFLAPDRARYLHAEGRPCERRFADHSHLLETPSTDPAET